MPRNTRSKEVQPDSVRREGLPFVPKVWPSYEQFKAAFDKTAERRRQRQTEPDEDGYILMTRPSHRLIIND